MEWIEIEVGYDKDNNEIVIYDHCSGSEITRIDTDEDHIAYMEKHIDDIRITVPWVHIIENNEPIRTERTQ